MHISLNQKESMKTNILSLPLKITLALPLVVGLFSSQAKAQQPIAPTLTLDFEHDINGVGQNGQTIKARLKGNEDLENGKFGKALKTGPGGGYLYFPTKNIVSPQAGTVEMWVCPQDWNGAEQAFHMFFQAKGAGEEASGVAAKGALYLYKYYRSVLGLVMLTSGGDKNKMAFSNVDTWKPGEWHFIAGTWSPALQCLYIDGKRVNNTLPNLPKALTEEFMIGDNPWNPSVPRTSNSLIDNVRIYNIQLSPEAIAAHYDGDYSKFVGISDKTARLDFTVDTKQKKIQPVFTLMGAEADVSTALADFSVSQNGKIIQQSKNNSFNGVSSNGEFQDNMPAGDYVLKVNVHNPSGGSIGELTKTLTVPSREWLGNTLGEEKKVLPPWTPIQINTTSPGHFAVQVWGREYQFNNSVLPVQIISQDQPMLQSPMALKVLLGGKELQWSNVKSTLQNASGYEANILCSADLNAPQGKVLLQVKYHIEYDGLMVCTFDWKAPNGFKPDAVTLDIPLRQERAIYQHGWDANLKANSGDLPEGNGVIVHDSFRPAAWLGDNDRGLFWFCESAQNWPNWQKDDAFQTVRENGTVTLRFNLLHGQALPADWNYQCGLQATPVKPRPVDWRNKRLAPPGDNSKYEILWPTIAPDSQKYYGYPEATNPAAFQKRIDNLHAKGLGAIPYSCLMAISSASPEWKWFGQDWSVHAADGGSSDVAAMGASFEYVSPTVKSWQDFIIWKNKQFIDRYHLNGYYHDLTYPRGYAVPSANTGWFDGKTWQKTYPVLAYRELYRRLYAITKAADPNAFDIGHMSSRVFIPVLAYEDGYLDGETLRASMIGKDNYMDVLPLDKWRAEYTGRQWGPIPIFLPEFDAVHSKEVEPTRGLAALLLLHDVTVWPVWCNVSVIKTMRDAKDAFGMDNAEFIPYFDSSPPAVADMKDVYISVYKKPDGRTLIVVGNTSNDPRNGTVTLNTKRIGIDAAKVLSWPDQKPVSLNDNTIPITIPGRDYQLFVMEK